VRPILFAHLVVAQVLLEPAVSNKRLLLHPLVLERLKDERLHGREKRGIRSDEDNVILEGPAVGHLVSALEKRLIISLVGRVLRVHEAVAGDVLALSGRHENVGCVPQTASCQ
jgi:hypothetical protein